MLSCVSSSYLNVVDQQKKLSDGRAPLNLIYLLPAWCVALTSDKSSNRLGSVCWERPDWVQTSLDSPYCKVRSQSLLHLERHWLAVCSAAAASFGGFHPSCYSTFRYILFGCIPKAQTFKMASGTCNTSRLQTKSHSSRWHLNNYIKQPHYLHIESSDSIIYAQISKKKN